MWTAPGCCLVALLAAVPVAAGPDADHLVGLAQVDGSLDEAASARDREKAAVRALLATPAAQQIARRVGLTEARLDAGMAALSDADLHDLADRAASLQTDPVAGQTYGPDLSGLGTAVVVGGVLLLLIATLVALGIASLF